MPKYRNYVDRLVKRHRAFIQYILIPIVIAIVLANVYPYYNHPPWKNNCIYPYSKGETLSLILLSFYLSFTVLVAFTLYPISDLSMKLRNPRERHLLHIGLLIWCSIPLLIGLATVILPLYYTETVDLEKAFALYKGFDYAQTIYSIELLLNIPLALTVFYILVKKRRPSLSAVIKVFIGLFIVGFIVVNAAMLTQVAIDLLVMKLGHSYLYIYFRGYNPGILRIMSSQGMLVEAILPTWGFLLGLILWAYILKRILEYIYFMYL